MKGFQLNPSIRLLAPPRPSFGRTPTGFRMASHAPSFAASVAAGSFRYRVPTPVQHPAPLRQPAPAPLPQPALAPLRQPAPAPLHPCGFSSGPRKADFTTSSPATLAQPTRRFTGSAVVNPSNLNLRYIGDPSLIASRTSVRLFKVILILLHFLVSITICTFYSTT